MVTSRRIFLKIRNVSGKFCRENQVTFYLQQHFYENRPSMRKFGKSFVQPDEAQVILQ